MKRKNIISASAIFGAALAVFASTSAQAADFGGAYVGGDVGYSTSDIGTDDAKGVTGGVFAGYGVEMDKWYLGGEIGGGFTGVKGNLATGELEKKNYYNGQARIGYKATDSLLAYGVIGLEGAEFDANGQSERDWAYKYGVGVETFVKDNISIRGQVDYVDWQGDNGLPGEPEWRTTLGAAYHF